MHDDEWNELVEKCKKDGLRVVRVDPDVLADYAGMNYYASKKFGFRKNMKPNEIYIDKTLPLDVQCRTLRHEMIERKLMAGGMDYWDAHRIATRKEIMPKK